MFFNKTTILGVGLLGASFSLALKKHGLCSHISGYGRSRENLERAKGMGIIDSFSTDPASACTDADLVLLSAPVGAFPGLIQSAAASLKKGAVVTDVGSVKGSLVSDIEKLMPSGVHFIGSHPIAGSDRSGIDFSNADLFGNALCIVTPTQYSEPSALSAVIELWTRIGSRVLQMNPADHDRTYAAVSHLPHIIAYAMVNTVSDINSSYLSYCGQGFRDMTRIAGSSPEIWTDIAMLNRENLIQMIAVFRNNLNTMESCLNTLDAAALKQEFIKASRTRYTLGQD